MSSLSKEEKENLEKQQYRIIGEHSAVKICGWTKKSIRGEGSCYKSKFYGINSEQCMQLTTSFNCANRCKYCWRSHKSKLLRDDEWPYKIDPPELIFERAEEEQKSLLVGFKGYDGVDKDALERSKNIKHVALSLTGEPILYPRINKFIELCHEKKVSTFLVSNGQYPDKLKSLPNVTQLYLSIDAPTKELREEISIPLFEDSEERFQRSLKIISERDDRTCLRITLIKNKNMKNPEMYASMINKGKPDFVELKGYMFLGDSRKRMKKENMPLHDEVKSFSEKVLSELENYSFLDEHSSSRVVALARNDMEEKAKIDFQDFFEKHSGG